MSDGFMKKRRLMKVLTRRRSGATFSLAIKAFAPAGV